MPLITLTPFNAVIPETLTYYNYTSSLLPTAYWRLGDVPPASIDDNFTGIDGQPPNPFLWNPPTYDPVIDNGAQGVVTLQGNTMDMAITNDIANNVVSSIHWLSGDLDVQIDFTMDSIPPNEFAFGLLISNSPTVDLFSATSSHISRYNTLFGPYRTNSTGGTATQGGTEDTFGKFRIARAGSTINTYYWDNVSAWVLLAAKSFVIDDMYIITYNRTWSANQTLNVNFDNFVVNSGTIINVIASEENNLYTGDYINNPVLDSPSLLQIETDNPAVSFNGSDQYIDVPSITSIISNNTPFSVVFLSSSALPAANDGYIMLPGTTTSNGLVIWEGTSDASYGEIAMGNSTVDWTSVHARYEKLSNIPYHIVITYNGVDWDNVNGYQFFINGEQKPTDASGNYNPITINNLEIANITPIAGREFFGTMDEVALFNYQLSAAEISQMFTLTGIGTYFNYMMSLSPIAYWRLGEDTGETIAIDSVGSFDGTYINNPTLGTAGLLLDGSVDTAVSFNGTNDYVDANTINTNLQTHTTGSVVYLVNIPSGQAGGFYMGDASSDGSYMQYSTSEGGVAYAYKANGALVGVDNFTIVTTDTLLPDITYHIVFTHDVTEGILIYVNGVLKVTTVTNGGTRSDKWWDDNTLLDTASINALIRPGVIYHNSTTDEVVIYDKVLSSEEVAQSFLKSGLYNSQYSNYVISLTPIAYWRLSEVSGTTAVDSIGSFDGTYVNTPTLGVTGLLVDDINTAVSFDGTNQYTSLPVGIASGVTDEFSIAMLIDSVSVAQQQLISLNNDGIFTLVRINSGGVLNDIRFYVEGSTKTADFVVNVSTANDKILLVLTAKDGGDVSGYVNGTLVGTDTITGFTDLGFEFGNNIGTGRNASSSFFNGTIDEVSFFSKVLSQPEITNMYNKSIGN